MVCAGRHAPELVEEADEELGELEIALEGSFPSSGGAPVARGYGFGHVPTHPVGFSG